VPTRESGPAVLAECRDAEDYFRLLGVEYDEQVLAVGRLHILKLFGAELAVDGADAAAADLARCRAALERAYAALVSDGPLGHRVFKVLRDRAPGQFVPDGDLVVEDAEGTS
jgi:nitrogenase-stabilizing/protective protein